MACSSAPTLSSSQLRPWSSLPSSSFNTLFSCSNCSNLKHCDTQPSFTAAEAVRPPETQLLVLQLLRDLHVVLLLLAAGAGERGGG